MKVKKKIKKGETGSVKVDPDVLYSAKKYCAKSGLKITVFVTSAINDKLAIINVSE